MIQVKALKKDFVINSGFMNTKKGTIKAVNGVSFEIKQGQTLGLVGESGSGKSTTGRLILRLLKPTSGQILLNQKDISNIPDKQFRKMRKDLQIIFQNPYSALDSKMSVKNILTQPLQIHKIVPPLEYGIEVERLLEKVGLSPEDANKFPHEFSGGQRQRIVIAKALASRPKFIVCDEPVSSLDISVQSQILNLMMELQKKHQLSYLFISHDLNVIRHVSHTVAVMYLGKILEQGHVDAVFKNPLHPYTKALLQAVPKANPEVKRKKTKLMGEIPRSFTLPEGCLFHTRCPYKMSKCTEIEPSITMIQENHYVSCHLLNDME